MPQAAMALLLGALIPFQGSPEPEPLTLHNAYYVSIRAVEGDSVDAVRARWTEQGREPGQERVAALGVAYLDIHTYRYAEAEQSLEDLLRGVTERDSVAPFALLARGQADLQRARYPEALRALRQAVNHPVGASDPVARTLGLVRLSGVAARVEGADAITGLFEEVSRILPAGDPYLAGLFRCSLPGRGETGAREDVEAGIVLAEEAGVRRLRAMCRSLIAQLEHRAGDVTTALGIYDEVQQEQLEARDHGSRAASLQRMGYVFQTAGWYGEARGRFQEAIAEGERSGNLSPVGWAYVGLAAVSNVTGDFGSALQYADRATALFEEQGDRGGLGAVGSTRAFSALALGLWDEAERFYSASVGPEGGSPPTHQNLARIALGRGDLERAEQELAEAFRQVEVRGMPGWRIGLLTTEAEIAAARRDYERARGALEESLLVIQSPVRRYRLLAQYAGVLASTGSAHEAADSLDSALAELERWRATLDPTGLRRYAFQMEDPGRLRESDVANVIAALAERGEAERAFELSERIRARLLLERLVRARILREGQVEVEESDLGRAAAAAVTWSSVAERLPEGTAVVVYVTGRGRPTTGMLVQRSGVEAVALEPADSLAPAIARLVANMDNEGVAAGLASRLGQALLGPMLADLDEDTKTLVIVPDGPLHRLPFAVLGMPYGDRVFERYVVAVAPSVTTFLALGEGEAGGPGRILAFGDPSLPEQSLASSVPEALQADMKSLSRLPGAAAEARRVGRYAAHRRVLLREAATEAALRASHASFNVLHFASHALVGAASDERVALLLAPGEGQDGVVGPGDLASLDLSGTDLVFLSACETTSGQVLQGEGLQGLVAPLLSAGVRTVVATAWQVEDRAAASIAEDFYRGLARGLPAGQALRGAQQRAAADGVPTSQWGAFMLVGDPHLTLELVEPGLGWPSYVGLFVLMALLGAVLRGILRRRAQGERAR